MFDFKIKLSDKKLRLNIIFFRIKKIYHKPRNWKNMTILFLMKIRYYTYLLKKSIRENLNAYFII